MRHSRIKLVEAVNADIGARDEAPTGPKPEEVTDMKMSKKRVPTKFFDVRLRVHSKHLGELLTLLDTCPIEETQCHPIYEEVLLAIPDMRKKRAKRGERDARGLLRSEAAFIDTLLAAGGKVRRSDLRTAYVAAGLSVSGFETAMQVAQKKRLINRTRKHGEYELGENGRLL